MYWDCVQFLSNYVIINDEMVDVEEVRLPTVTLFDTDIFRGTGLVNGRTIILKVHIE